MAILRVAVREGTHTSNRAIKSLQQHPTRSCNPTKNHKHGPHYLTRPEIDTEMATDELLAKLQRRNDIIDKDEDGLEPELPSLKVFNPYTEFKEFSRKEIQGYQKTFNEYDIGKDKFIDFMELKRLMEKIGAPQTHLALKEMIREVDEDKDSKISFREFLLIFRKAAAGELAADSGLLDLYTQLNEIDVDKEGVKGAKGFFESKINDQTKSSKFEAEIREEQEERKRQEEEKKERRAAFKEKAALFK